MSKSINLTKRKRLMLAVTLMALLSIAVLSMPANVWADGPGDGQNNPIRTEYTYPQDHQLLPGKSESVDYMYNDVSIEYDDIYTDRIMLANSDDIDIEQYNNVYVQNDSNPSGVNLKYEVMKVEATEQIPEKEGSNVVNITGPILDKEGKYNIWKIEAKDTGSAIIKVTYEDPEEIGGETKSYTFTVTVTDTKYSMDIFSEDRSDRLIPGSVIRMSADARCYTSDGKSTSDGFTYQWEICKGDRFAEFVDEQGNVIAAPVTADALLRFKNPDNKQNLDERILVKCTAYRGTDGNGTPIKRGEDSVNIYLRDYYYAIVLKDADGNTVDAAAFNNLKVNESISVKPELRKYTADKNQGYTVIDPSDYGNFQLRWDYSRNTLSITDKNGNAVFESDDGEYTGSTDSQYFTLTRLNADSAFINLKAYWSNSNDDEESYCLEDYEITEIEDPNSGDNSGGSGGGAAGTPEPEEEQPVQPTPVTDNDSPVEVTAVVENGSAYISPISAEELDKVEAGEIISLNVSATDASAESVTSVSIPTETVKNISESKAEAVEVKLDSATALIDQATLATIANQAQGTDVKFVVDTGEKAVESLSAQQKEVIEGMTNAVVIDAHFESNKVRISDFGGGKVEFKVAYSSDKAIRVWFVNDNGALEEIPSSYDAVKKIVTFSVTHFSTYAIEEYDAKANNMSVKALKMGAAVKFTKLKKASQTIAVKKLMSVRNADGKVTYKKIKVNKRSSNFKIDPKSGKITVKKGTKKGTYKIRIRVNASGEGDYLPASKVVSCKIRIK